MSRTSNGDYASDGLLLNCLHVSIARQKNGSMMRSRVTRSPLHVCRIMEGFVM